jgi:hypothetical protein
MGKVSGTSWWHSIGFGMRRVPEPESDFANMGTAFGLDASMGDGDHVAVEPKEGMAPPDRRPEARDSRTSRRP